MSDPLQLLNDLERKFAAGAIKEQDAEIASLREQRAALLAACEAAVHLYEQGCVDRGYKDDRNWIDEVSDQLDDAIAKAKGTP